MPNKATRIIAVDPGYERLGIAIMEAGRPETVIYSTCFQTPKSLPHPARLAAVRRELERLILEFSPTVLATETLFFSKNQKTALAVAETRGVILSLASEQGLDIYEYAPVMIKIAVTGYGASDKKQVATLVGKLVRLEKALKYDDEYDAIAIGLTCFARERGFSTGRAR
jgi:crossover junction endodeoxyribonuclease RuvC